MYESSYKILKEGNMGEDKIMRKISAMYRWSGGTDYRHTCYECSLCVRRKRGNRIVSKCLAYGDTASQASDWKESYIACKHFGGPVLEIPVIRLGSGREQVEEIDGQMSIFDCGVEI